MSNKQTSFDRLCLLRDWLRHENPKITEAAIERKMGVATNYFKTRSLAPIAKGDKGLRTQTIEKVKQAWRENNPATPPLNVNWLVSGEGEMFLDSQTVHTSKGIPCYDDDFLQSDVEDGLIKKEPAYYISIPQYMKTGIICVGITGSSMSPSINSGDKIIIQRIPLTENIIYGEIYAVITNSGMRTVRRIIRSGEPECLRLIPENKDPRYGDYQDIPKTDIKSVFKVLCAIKTF